MKKLLTKIGNPPYFGQFEAPPSLFCTRPFIIYPQGVLKVPVGVNNNLLAPVMGRGGVTPSGQPDRFFTVFLNPSLSETLNIESVDGVGLSVKGNNLLDYQIFKSW